MTDSDGVSRQFDPRFSPAFQPGYDSRVHREEPPRGALRDDSVSSSGSIAPGFPGFAVPEAEAEGATIATEPRAAMGPEGEADVHVGLRRVNPWIISLWVLGILFIAAGFGSVFIVAEWQRSPGFGAVDGYFASILGQLVFFGAPMLVVLGLATLTSSIAIFALRWRR